MGGRRNYYGPVKGGATVRNEVAGYFTRRSLPTDSGQVMVAPGSKALLMALNLVVPGDVLIARPSWVTYAPQAELAGKRPLGVGTTNDTGGVPEADALRSTIRAARADGHHPRVLVMTLPDNPTGTNATPDHVTEICAIAEEEDLLVVSDEIYRDLLHDPDTAFLSPAEVAPQRTIVVTGLSKSLALGGWRIGAARFPNGQWGNAIQAEMTAVSSEVWSTLASPMQAVAEYAFSEPPELCSRVAADARLHGIVAQAVHRILVEGGATNPFPTAAFYCYPDLEPLREPLSLQNVMGGAELQRFLLEEFGIAVLSGHHFGDDPGALRFRMATSMLYGETESLQLETLYASDPLRLGHIDEALTRISEAMTKIAL